MRNRKSTIQIRTNVWDSVQGVIIMDEREDDVLEMTNEEYRKRIISIFMVMDRTDKLRFWYRYISAIEKGEC